MIAGFASFLTDTLVWTGALIALVLVLRRPVARVFGPGMSYALWLLPLLRFALPPIPLPADFAPAPAASVPAAAGVEIVTITVAAPAAPEVVIPWALLLTSAWLLGAVLFLVARWLEYKAMRRRLLTGAVEVDRREGVRIVETPAVDAPVALGVRDKVIALPPRFLITGSLAERALAIEHELAHHRGHDLIANIAAQPLLALHWFNPLAWAAWSAMRRDQEAACDARAMAGRDARTRAQYARVIASFTASERLGAGGSGGTALAAPMACPVLGDKSIVHRLRSLTMSDISPRRRRAAHWLLGATTALALPMTATVVYAGHEERDAATTTKPAPRVEKRFVIVDVPEGASPDDASLHTRTVVRDGKTIVLKTRTPVSEAEAEAQIAKAEAHLRATEAMHFAEAPEAPEPPEALEAPEPPEAPQPPEAPGHRREVRKIVMHGGDAHKAVASVRIMKDCGEARTLADVDVSRDGGEGGRKTVNRSRVLLCAPAHYAKAGAIMGVRAARDSIASNRSLSDEIRAEVLKELDETIADMEKDAG